ncbi:hypothetical protein B484DRAFT_410150, partial [Ochromonadaceae sp. CCMP2298]
MEAMEPMEARWRPLRLSMQLLCEPAFSAVNNWRELEDDALLQDRLQLVETARHMYNDFSLSLHKYEFDLQWEHPVPLLPEVPPTPGFDFQEGGDIAALVAAQTTLPYEVYKAAGYFVQNNL